MDSDKLDAIKHQLDRMETNMTQGFQDIQAELGRINAATTDLAGDITALIALVSTGMSADEVTQVKTGLADAASALEATASQFPAPPTP